MYSMNNDVAPPRFVALVSNATSQRRIRIEEKPDNPVNNGKGRLRA